ncbi:hypothetical protein IE4872_CH01551 [Rhizobium gallicum]|uniref:Uncharacterized protein n=1 Tax=Rhizobium gallicum TaxID=56730 RepID=A0A1L5NGZ7_9HYPH|nr:hypothetical protein IE4872_CH01551 [Rhizobium gallicum]
MIVDALGRHRSRSIRSSGTPGSPSRRSISFLLELDIGARLHRHPGSLVSLAMGD